MELGGKQSDFDCTLNIEMVKPADGFETEYQLKIGVKTETEDFKLNSWVR